MFGKENEQIPPVLAILILSDKGERVAVQYSPNAVNHALLASDEARKLFETRLIAKARKASIRLNQIEVVSFHDYLALYRYLGDASVIVIGDTSANEIMMLELAEAIYQAFVSKIGDKLSHSSLMRRLDQVILIIDEFVESGYIKEINPKCVLNRIGMID